MKAASHSRTGITRACLLFSIVILDFTVEAASRTCHYCNIVTDFRRPLERISCNTVIRAIMKDASLYTHTCAANEYCMHYKGQYRERGKWRYEEFAGCSGVDNIYIGDVDEEKATGTFVDWRKINRNGKICLSVEEKSCFDCNKTKCDHFWPKPDCPTGTLVIVEESVDQCCPAYTCELPRTCYRCNTIMDSLNSLDGVSCDTLKTALMMNETQDIETTESLYTTSCPFNQYCMYYKGLYRETDKGPAIPVEYAGCSGLLDIYVGDNTEAGKANGAFLPLEKNKRNETICLSMREKSCLDCDKSMCDQLWPKPECASGNLRIVDEFPNQCCHHYEYECVNPSSPSVTVIAVNVSAMLIVVIVGYVWYRLRKRRGASRTRAPADAAAGIQFLSNSAKLSTKDAGLQGYENSMSVTLYDGVIIGDPILGLKVECEINDLPRPVYQLLKTHNRCFSITCIIGIQRETGVGESETLAGRQAAHKMLRKVEDALENNINIQYWIGEEDENYTCINLDDNNLRGDPVGKLQKLCMFCSLPRPIYRMSCTGTVYHRRVSITCIIGKLRETGGGESEMLAGRQAANKMLRTLFDELQKQMNFKPWQHNENEVFWSEAHDDDFFCDIVGSDVYDDIPDDTVRSLCKLCLDHSLALPWYRLIMKQRKDDWKFLVICGVGAQWKSGSGKSLRIARCKAANKMMQKIKTSSPEVCSSGDESSAAETSDEEREETAAVCDLTDDWDHDLHWDYKSRYERWREEMQKKKQRNWTNKKKQQWEENQEKMSKGE